MLDNNLNDMKWTDNLKKVEWQGRLKSIGAFVLASLSPAFKAPTKENKIAYLDGLRGFAAFIVSRTVEERQKLKYILAPANLRS